MRRISVLGWVLIVIGVVLLVVGVIYATTTAPNLPGFLPGHVAHAGRARKYSKRALASFVLAIVAFGAAAAVTMRPSTPEA
jgi:uncharacterized membrane protein